MSATNTSINLLMLATQIPGYIKFKRSTSDPKRVQAQKLKNYVETNQNTQFGIAHSFSHIRSISDFQKQVPLTDYEDYRAWIEKIKKGERKVLSIDPVTRLMPTSGSTAEGKLIPYTSGLKKEFSLAISPWLLNFYGYNTKLLGGKAYWSVSPNINQEQGLEDDISTGFESDSEYVGGWGKALVEKTMAVSSGLARLKDFESYAYATVLALLKCNDLRLISIWHPTFLNMLSATMSKHWDLLLKDIRTGGISSCFDCDSIQASYRLADEDRSRYLENTEPSEFRSIWPNLYAVSCWGDAHAREALGELRRLHPTLQFYSKGLLATEGVVTFPFLVSNIFDTNQLEVKPLSIHSHFYEFISENGAICLAHELRVDGIYEVVITTAGGLYRYRTGDKVVVTAFLNATPCLTFVGKKDSVSDYFGEKLDDVFVATVLDKVLGNLQEEVSFSMLAPDKIGKEFFYTLYIQCSPTVCTILAKNLETELRSNVHYNLCRNLGQLGPVRVFYIQHDGNMSYLQHMASLNKKLGDIKPAKLSNKVGWSDIFEGYYLA